ncbi:Trypsin [Burkholderia sp. GAS332]|nr:Trypsin [Burkholderia sp. GAS332]
MLRKLLFSVVLLYGLFPKVALSQLATCSAPTRPGEIVLVQPGPGNAPRPVKKPGPSSARLSGLSSISDVNSANHQAAGLTAILNRTLSSSLIGMNEQVIDPFLQTNGIGQQLKNAQALAAQNANILNRLGYGGNQKCTGSIVDDASSSDVALMSMFVNDEAKISEARRAYVGNPTGYVAQTDSTTAAAVKDNVEKWRKVLANCFMPASHSLAFGPSGAAGRLGVIFTEVGPTCEGLLVTSDHILTARHCVYESKDITGLYTDGGAYFSVVGTPSKKYQVCSVVSSYSGKGKTLEDESVLLRIADTGKPFAIPDTVDTKIIEPLLTQGVLQMPTSLTAFVDIPHASDIDSSYVEDIGVPTAPGCYVLDYDSNQGCFTHFCPTYSGTSGSPMFVQSGNAYKILGVHIGPTIDRTGTYGTCTTHAMQIENSAVVVNKAKLSP